MKKTFVLLLVLAALAGKSQNFECRILFEGIGDNREYANSGKALSQTILGSRGAFEIGVEKDGHRIRGGLSHLSEAETYFVLRIFRRQERLSLWCISTARKN
jgi:hypothetical protein